MLSVQSSTCAEDWSKLYEKMLQFARPFIEIFQQEEKTYSLLMTDEAHFHLNGFVIKQNVIYRGVEKQQILNENELHPQRVIVWCAIMCGRIIGPYFFENAEGFTKTVNGDRYRHMLNTFLRPVVIHLRNRHELWFQQDGATCRTANETMNMLKGMLDSNIISRRAALTWTPRSPGPNYSRLPSFGISKRKSLHQ